MRRRLLAKMGGSRRLAFATPLSAGYTTIFLPAQAASSHCASVGSVSFRPGALPAHSQKSIASCHFTPAAALRSARYRSASIFDVRTPRSASSVCEGIKIRNRHFVGHAREAVQRDPPEDVIIHCTAVGQLVFVVHGDKVAHEERTIGPP